MVDLDNDLRSIRRKGKEVYDAVRFLKRVYDGECLYTLRVVAYVEYPEVFEALSRGRCPFCGKQAKAERWVWGHIRRNCITSATSVARDIYDRWSKARGLISEGKKGFTIKHTGRSYRTFEEAYRALREMDVILL